MLVARPARYLLGWPSFGNSAPLRRWCRPRTVDPRQHQGWAKGGSYHRGQAAARWT